MATKLHRADVQVGRTYLRPADVVRQTGLSKSTIMAALWSGQLEAYRLGRAWLIPVEAIDRWIRGATESA